MKLPENDLENFFRRCKNCWAPSEKQLRSATANTYQFKGSQCLSFFVFLMTTRDILMIIVLCSKMKMKTNTETELHNI